MIGVTNSRKDIVYKWWTDPRLEVRLSKIHGHGIFTRKSIRQGEVVIRFGGELFTMQEVREGKAKLESLSGFKEGMFLGQSVSGNEDSYSIDRFLNHSCNPNLWMVDERRLAARRDIAIDEELTADYAIWELDEKWELPGMCMCGSDYCRHSITGQDWHKQAVQEMYHGHFLPCINNWIEEQCSKTRFKTSSHLFKQNV